METEPDFAAKLKNSAPGLSLQREYDLGVCLHDCGWEVVHGAFYVDPIEGKPREIDLQARQVWIKGEGVDHELIATLELLIECKSITGWHLVFPEMFPVGLLSRLEENDRYWLCEDKVLRSRLLTWLHEQTLPIEDIEALGKALQSATYEDTLRRTAETVPAPMAAPHVASTFTETNTKDAKDIDNSVLWRAISSVRSAAIAARNRAHEAAFQILTTESDVGTPIPMNLMMQWNHASREVNIWQYIIVIGGELWALRGTDVAPIKWGRLVRMEGGRREFWWDVVTYAAAPSYFRDATAHFARCLERNGFAQR
jgi:hypothetical protein